MSLEERTGFLHLKGYRFITGVGVGRLGVGVESRDVHKNSVKTEASLTSKLQNVLIHALVDVAQGLEQ